MFAAAKLQVIACINDARKTKLAFISLNICTQLCCINGLWQMRTASGVIYECVDDMTYVEKIVCLQLCKYLCLTLENDG